VAKRHHQHEPPGTYRTFAWVALPARCSGRGSRRSWAQWPLPEASQPGSIGASASRHTARQAKLAEETVRWPRYVGSTGGGDADPDPTLACSRAGPRGGLSPLRRLTTIQDGRSWRRDPLAGPTTTEDPISRRSVVVYDLYRRALLQGTEGLAPVNNQHMSASLQKTRSSDRPTERPTSGALRSHAAPLATAAPADGLAGKRRRRSPRTVVSPHPCRTYGVASSAERPDSTALSRPSLIRPHGRGPPRGMRIGPARPSSAFLGAREPVDKTDAGAVPAPRTVAVSTSFSVA
jgi:hypothetical protein